MPLSAAAWMRLSAAACMWLPDGSQGLGRQQEGAEGMPPTSAISGRSRSSTCMARPGQQEMGWRERRTPCLASFGLTDTLSAAPGLASCSAGGPACQTGSAWQARGGCGLSCKAWARWGRARLPEVRSSAGLARRAVTDQAGELAHDSEGAAAAALGDGHRGQRHVLPHVPPGLDLRSAHAAVSAGQPVVAGQGCSSTVRSARIPHTDLSREHARC